MRFKYAQERVRQLKGSLEPTESSADRKFSRNRLAYHGPKGQGIEN